MQNKTKLRWQDVYSECGHYMIQTAHIRHAGTEYRLLYSADGGPPFSRGLGVYNTKRETKQRAQEHADANSARKYGYDDLDWGTTGDDGWKHAVIELADGETSWQPGSTKHLIYGPAVVRYDQAPDGGVIAVVESRS